jgi:large subunit ribosomal protein L29
MKAQDIRQLTRQEIMERIDEEEKNLSQMRFQLTTSQLANTSQVRYVRRDIARLKTVLKELERAGEQN